MALKQVSYCPCLVDRGVILLKTKLMICSGNVRKKVSFKNLLISFSIEVFSEQTSAIGPCAVNAPKHELYKGALPYFGVAVTPHDDILLTECFETSEKLFHRRK